MKKLTILALLLMSMLLLTVSVLNIWIIRWLYELSTA